jgi:uncharacterized protein YbcI
MMGMGMQVFIGVGLFLVNLVGKRVIRKMRDNDIQKGERVIFFHFHSKLDMGGNVF